MMINSKVCLLVCGWLLTAALGAAGPAAAQPDGARPPRRDARKADGIMDKDAKALLAEVTASYRALGEFELRGKRIYETKQAAGGHAFSRTITRETRCFVKQPNLFAVEQGDQVIEGPEGKTTVPDVARVGCDGRQFYLYSTRRYSAVEAPPRRFRAADTSDRNFGIHVYGLPLLNLAVFFSVCDDPTELLARMATGVSTAPNRKIDGKDYAVLRIDWINGDQTEAWVDSQTKLVTRAETTAKPHPGSSSVTRDEYVRYVTDAKIDDAAFQWKPPPGAQDSSPKRRP